MTLSKDPSLSINIWVFCQFYETMHCCIHSVRGTMGRSSTKTDPKHIKLRLQCRCICHGYVLNTHDFNLLLCKKINLSSREM